MERQAREELLKNLAREQAKESMRKEWLEKASDAEIVAQGLGLLIAHSFSWDGVTIMEVAALALEDANWHTEAGRLFDAVEEWRKKT